MDNQAFFQTTYKQAAQQIAASLPSAMQTVAPSFPGDDPLRTELMRFVTEGGKRFRPALSLVVAGAYGQPGPYVHTALETFHKYLLAHDDIIDRDTVRYGAPTVHAGLRYMLGRNTDAEHFGNSLGIIAGDLLEAATQRIILEAKLSARTTRRLQLLLNQALNEATWGWYDQFLMDYEPLDSSRLSRKRIERSLVWVTGRYSIKLPLYFGLAVAGQAERPGLEALADTLGLLYQTGDDLIGIFGDSKQTGKSNSGDLSQGKKTLPLWLAYTSAPKHDRRILAAVVGDAGATGTMLEEARVIIRRHGLPQAQAAMAKWQTQAHTQLARLQPTLPAEVCRFLAGMTDYLVERNY